MNYMVIIKDDTRGNEYTIEMVKANSWHEVVSIVYTEFGKSTKILQITAGS